MKAPTTTLERPTLDFAVIRQQCPKAFNCLCTWVLQITLPHQDVIWLGEYNATYSNLDAYNVPAHPRDLYDFFDGQGVIVSVTAYTRYFLWDINQSHFCKSNVSTRAEAETAAFGAAFDRLEVILNQKEK